MGEANRMRARVINGNPCIYCNGNATTVEHMPPKIMFLNKYRPKGMEFPACSKCNCNSGPSDLVASMLARLDTSDDIHSQAFKEACSIRDKLLKSNPQLIADLFDDTSTFYAIDHNGIVKRFEKKEVESDILARYLDTFSSKLAMALFYNHVGRTLPNQGLVFTRSYLNSGLTQGQLEATLSIMPGHNFLKQGAWQVNDQFEYRYNTDEKSIVAAHAKFHRGLQVTVFAIDGHNDIVTLLRSHGLSESKPGFMI